MSAVNQVTTDGSPDFLVQDVPPHLVARPRDHAAAHLLRRDRDRLHARQDEGAGVRLPGRRRRRLHQYTGTGGIPIGSFLAKLAFSWRFGTIKFFTTSAIDSDSRVIIRNNIMDRAERGGPVPALRPGPVHGDRRRAALLDRRRLHDDRPLPVLDARTGRQLHPQLGQGGRRRLQRHDELLRLRRVRSRSSGRTRRSTPSSSSRRARCPPPSASTSATRRSTSTCSPRCTRRTT